jgi:multidrug efflux system outer membrane protein
MKTILDGPGRIRALLRGCLAPGRAPRAWAASVTCVLLTGCIHPMGPNYKRPPVPLPTSWRVEIKDAADITNSPWWRAFGDENLDRLIDQALHANADLLIATARVEQFAAKLESTHSQFFPQLGADLGFERDQRSQEVPELLRPGQPPAFDQYKGLLTISYELDLWGRVRRSYEASRAQLLATQQARHTVMLTVVTSVAGTYFTLLAQDRELELARQTRDSLKATWELTDKKYHGGSATDIDVGVAQAEYEDQVALIPDIERRIAFLEDSLSTLLGRNPGPIARGRLENLVLMSVPGGIPADVLTRRPDVLAAEQDLVGANARIGIAKSEYFPTFSLTSSYGQSSDMTRWLLARTARTGDLAIDLMGPIFTFGRVEGDVRAARAETKEQQIRYLQTVQTALREVDDALVANEKARVRAAALGRHTATLQNVDYLTRKRFQGGSSTHLDLLYADRSVYAAQTQANTAQREELLALVAVFKAMGGGWMLGQDQALANSIKTSNTEASAP